MGGVEPHLDQRHGSSVTRRLKQQKPRRPLNKDLTLFFCGPRHIIEHRTLFFPVVATLIKPRLIGVVACDSGRICIADPSHLKADQGSVHLPAWNLHTSVDTEIGDGEFSVYEERDKRGRLRRVIIELD